MIKDSFLVAPFWNDHDLRLDGSLTYNTYRIGVSQASDYLLNNVSTFIRNKEGVNFTGSWMLVAYWDSVHPYPHYDVLTSSKGRLSNLLEFVQMVSRQLVL